jgi:hypothetical protein
VQQVTAFAQQHDLLYLAGDGEPIEPRLDSVAAAARNSHAAQFVRDPVAFLEQLSRAKG